MNNDTNSYEYDPKSANAAEANTESNSEFNTEIIELPDAADSTAHDFEAVQAVDAANKSQLTEAQAEEFIALSHGEHRRHLLSHFLVLFAPAALFFTLWFPLPEKGNFAQVNPTAATITGLVIALAFILVGLAIHFAPKQRSELLQQVENRELVASPASTRVVETQILATGKTGKISNIFGILGILAALAFAVLAITSLGNVGLIFLFAALALTCAAIAFCFLYTGYHSKRIMYLLALES